MKKNFILIVFFFIITSCETYKNEYIVATKIVSNLKTPFYNKNIFKINIYDTSFVLDKKVIEFVDVLKKRKVSGISCADCGNIVWESGYEDVINNDDILFLINEIENKVKIKWDVKKFKTNLEIITFKNTPRYDENTGNDMEEIIKFKSDFIQLSTPIFNKKKNICFVHYKYPLLTGIDFILVYKKEKELWNLIAHYE